MNDFLNPFSGGFFSAPSHPATVRFIFEIDIDHFPNNLNGTWLLKF